MNDNQMIGRFALVLTLTLLTSALAAQPRGAWHTFTLRTDEFLLDGKPYQIISGEMNSRKLSRITAGMTTKRNIRPPSRVDVSPGTNAFITVSFRARTRPA